MTDVDIMDRLREAIEWERSLSAPAGTAILAMTDAMAHLEVQRKVNVDLFNECLRLKAENDSLRGASLGKISEIKQALEYCRATGID